MKTLSSTDLRANHTAVMDWVNDADGPVLITRANGCAVVMDRLKDRGSMGETKTMQ